MKVEKTNVARLLDSARIEYQLIPYEVDISDLSAVHVAELLSEPVEKVFKTLVLKGDKTGYFICIIPGAEELDLKQAAYHSGNKSCEMIQMKDLIPVTGYMRGACSPIGMKKQFPAFIDESCMNYDKIYVSAGKRGLQLYISTKNILELIGAGVCFLIKKQNSYIFE